MIKVEAPARICFFGDHQDYLNLPVIAGTINRYIYIEGEPINQKTFNIQLLDIKEFITINLDEKYRNIKNEDYFFSVIEVLKKAGYSFSQGYRIKISGTIPINAGLSSSSALVVAWIRFLLATQEKEKFVTDEQIGRWAYEAEVSYFNQSGGLMDQYTIAQKGLLYIDTLKGKTEPLKANLGSLVIAESGLSKQTQSVLQNARKYGQAAISAVLDKVPKFNIHEADETDYKEYLNFVPELYQDHWYAAIFNHLLTKKAREMMKSDLIDFEKLGSWMNSHQKILQERIQNTPNVMQEQMNAALNSGALGTKIIGSGGGGCMVAMVNEENKEKVIQAFINKGAKAAYEINLITPI